MNRNAMRETEEMLLQKEMKRMWADKLERSLGTRI